MNEETKRGIERTAEEIKVSLSDLVNCSLGRPSKLAIANAVYARVNDIMATLLEVEKQAVELAAKVKEQAPEPEKKAE